MFSDKHSVIINASAETIWKQITDLESGYAYEHESVEVISADKTFKDGLRFREKERIGGVLAVVEAEVFDVIENRQYCFRGEAQYHHLGLTIPVQEGGRFTIEPVKDQSRLSLEARGELPKTLFGRIVELYATKLLKIDEALARHNVGELTDFKRKIEQS